MALIQFYRGKRDSYDKEKMGDGVYFCTDESTIIANGKNYYGEIKDIKIDGETLVIEK